MGIRKNYNSLTSEERSRFVQGLHRLKDEGVVDDFARMHARHAQMGIHKSSHFLPWHREFIYRFEKKLQAHYPSVSLPYWDSTVDRSSSDPLWKPDFLGQFNGPWRLNRVLGVVTLPTEAQVRANQQRGTYSKFWRELESDIHNPPHNWVGGVMASFTSPGDPVFFLHHSCIDMLWVRWRKSHPDVPFVASRPGFGVNDPLMEWPNRTPADVLDHTALGYSYDIEGG
ncbi:tyrosinase family protein [Actinomadura adrarensis]|uniref:Tyrosinase family protein n=1 Tax=Actinomadura adrarensis TaxID=1819600 RepID=A0ABW3CSF2_9ACTN